MALLNITSPHTHGANRTGRVMRLVVYATFPGIAALTHFFGIGVLINVLLASITCVAFEAAVMKLRQRPVMFYLADCSALVTGILIGVSLPAYCPWWLIVSASFIAIVLAKQLYGGMGFNPFNPAMVAYALLLVSFPLQMTSWPTPLPLLPDGQATLSLVAALDKIFFGTQIDGYSSATVLDIMKQNAGLTLNDLYKKEAVFDGRWAGAGWEWVNIAFLIGGIYLLYKKVFTWHAPVSMLAALTVMAALFYDSGSSNSSGSPIFHLLSGATMLGAFFIVTDPVTSAVSNKGRIVYGASIGVLIYVIRSWGTSYPDGVAFAVLLLNFASPFIDYYTTPRTYGHKKPRRATDSTPRDGH
ncbi:MAG: electron transport complex subunit RsxD [Cellvibrio sp. 79]|nr:MAG: electron transport complex subunit RsxD [Cellvibrio sp. 79]